MIKMNESDRVAFNEIIDNLYIINLTDYGKKIVTNGVKDLQHQLEKQNSVIEEIKNWLKDENNQKYSRDVWNYNVNNWILNKINELEKLKEK